MAQGSVTGRHVLFSAIPTRLVGGLLFQVAMAVVGSMLLILSAKFQVPFYPVPMSMQTFVVLGLGFMLGARLAAVSVALYLAEGALGLPVFAGTPEKGVGIAYMMGPTGGYLVGFLAAAVVCGLLAKRGWGKSHISAAAGMLIGNIVIYVPGLLWLGAVAGWNKPILDWGLYPFIIGDLTKLALAAALLPAALKLADRSGRRQ